MILATNSTLPFPREAHAALLMVIGQLDNTFAEQIAEQHERYPYRTRLPEPDSVQMGHLEVICDAIVSSIDSPAMLSVYRFGAVAGKTLGRSEWQRRELFETERGSVRTAIVSLPADLRKAFQNLSIALDQSESVGMENALAELLPNYHASISGLIYSVADELARLNDTLHIRALDSTDVGRQIQVEALDGPEPPDGFGFNGRRYDVPPGVVFRLIDTLWRVRNRTLPFRDLEGPVWEHDEACVSESMVASARSRANKFFLTNALPFTITTCDSHVRLVDTRRDEKI